jgi:hypothetical protein
VLNPLRKNAELAQAARLAKSLECVPPGLLRATHRVSC